MEIGEALSERICLSIIIMFTFFSFIDFIFLSFVAYYIKKNNNKNITLLWIDYVITIINGFIFSVIYITNLIVNYKNRIKYFEDIYSNKLNILTNSFLMLFFYTSINNLIFDIVKSIQLSFKIMKFKKINTQDLKKMVNELKLINIMYFMSPRKHYNFTFVMNVINVLIVGFFIIVYTRIDIQNNYFSIQDHNRYLLQYYHFLILGLLLICFLFINPQKKSLANKYYYSDNIDPIESNNGESKTVYQYDLNGNYITKYKSCIEAGKNVNVTKTAIASCCRGVCKTVKNFIWSYKYADNYYNIA